MDPSAIAAVFAQTDRELWLLTAAAQGRRGGLIATFVNQASIVPEMPRVVVGLAHQHHTWGLVEASGAFTLHLLAMNQVDLVWRFGLASGRGHDKLADLSLHTGETGALILSDTPSYLECRVEARWDTGDRTLYLAAVVAGAAVKPGPVLTMRYLVEQAPPEKLRELREGLIRDAAADAAAIQNWRQQQRPS